jgi:hypothetical protein
LDADEACAQLGDGYRVEARMVLWETRGARSFELGRQKSQEAEVVSGLTRARWSSFTRETTVSDSARIAVRSQC